ncbi:MAG: hypothetical protein ACE5IW_13835, partial [bacterium]
TTYFIKISKNGFFDSLVRKQAPDFVLCTRPSRTAEPNLRAAQGPEFSIDIPISRDSSGISNRRIDFTQRLAVSAIAATFRNESWHLLFSAAALNVRSNDITCAWIERTELANLIPTFKNALTVQFAPEHQLHAGIEFITTY